MPAREDRGCVIGLILGIICLLAGFAGLRSLLSFEVSHAGPYETPQEALQWQQTAVASNNRFQCRTVPPEVVAHLEAGLDIPFGSLRGARFVNARHDFDTWVIVADVQGWGYWGSADYALWSIASPHAMNQPTLRASDPITSLNALAAQHSAFPFNARNPGTIDEALRCARIADWPG